MVFQTHSFGCGKPKQTVRLTVYFPQNFLGVLVMKRRLSKVKAKPNLKMRTMWEIYCANLDVLFQLFDAEMQPWSVVWC